MVQKAIHPVSRRTVLAAGAALLAKRNGFGADAALHFTILDHVSLAVADVAKSVDFYARIFGNTLRKENDADRYYVRLGLSYLAMGRNEKAGRIDHFCAGFEAHEMANAKAHLNRLGIKFTSPPPFGLFFADPEGIRVQMWTDNSWNDVGRTASPFPHQIPEAPIFEPTRLDHLVLAVSDLGEATAYYRKLLGPVIREQKAKQIWFKLGPSRIGLIQAASGDTPRIERFCVAATPFDSSAAAKKLTDASAKTENAERKGSVKFRDLDGILVEVI